MERAGLPAGVFSYVLGAGNEFGQALVADPRIKAVGFTGSWLEGMQANTPRVFKGVPFGAVPIINAVAGGELAEVGFGSHFYLYNQQANGDAMNVAAKFYPGDPAGLLSVDGVGIIKGTDNPSAANAFVDFMLSQTAEEYFAAGNVEIPIIESIAPRGRGLTAEGLAVPGLDMQLLEELDDTRDLLTEVGIIM